jgi:hypothetical protein
MYNTNVFRYLLHGFMIILLQTLGTDKPICYSVQLGVRLWNLDWLGGKGLTSGGGGGGVKKLYFAQFNRFLPQ